MTLRVGIIGCGGIAGLHVRGYKESEGVEVVACTDLNAERTRSFAEKHEIKNQYPTVGELLEKEKLDAVSVCTPNYAHCEPTIAALRQGVSVLCEKPIAMNSLEAVKMVE